ncbi:MAG: Holliday junction resolvase RuvX [Alistipes sp.]|nr:Holliday junction resolvase RuvX [Alistipes sp.]MBR1995156.1 Holliday junction resolvase RuvX [Alistipes sp.]MBR3846846.1 Holliday junction resolvase RuvX [Alistipes sp.]
MGRILAIDYGRARTGLAVSDPLQMIAGGLATVPTKELERFIADYLSREEVSTIVLGKPMQMNGEPSETWRYIEPLARRLQAAHPSVEVTFYDERFTSVLAHRAMIDGGMKKSDRRNKAVVDKIAATIILEDYLQFRR